MDERKWIAFRGKIGADGRITLPKAIRESEDIQEGDFVDVKVRKVE